ncbi:MAG: site-2 protease family protein [Opitutales bacterium]|nr:site-2 protease family protein [Opitutales bacterium]
MSEEIISQIRSGGILYVLLVIAITMREFGRAYAADKLGCVLPRMQGRVTINPLAHMDLMGTVIFPIMCIALSTTTQLPLIFGWGKPVHTPFTNPKTYVRDDVVSTLAGPAMNLVVGLISTILLTVFLMFDLKEYVYVAEYSIAINVMIFVLNMLPIPQSEGARVLRHIIKMSDSTNMAIARYGIFIFLAVIFLPPTRYLLTVIINLLYGMFILIAKLILAVFAF